MPGLPIFPAHRLNPDSVTPRVARRVVSGGTALSGDEDVIQTDGGGRIEIAYGEMAFDTPALQRLLNQWDSFASGGANVFLVPLVTLATAPRPWANGAPRPVSEFGDNDPVFPTVVGYRQPLIVAVTVGDAAVRATVLTVEIVKGSPILGGEWFSVGERSHRIERVTARVGLQATVVVNPPLREAIPAASPVEFEWPVQRSRVPPGTDMAAVLQYGRFGDTTLTFVEAP